VDVRRPISVGPVSVMGVVWMCATTCNFVTSDAARSRCATCSPLLRGFTSYFAAFRAWGVDRLTCGIWGRCRSRRLARRVDRDWWSRRGCRNSRVRRMCILGEWILKLTFARSTLLAWLEIREKLRLILGRGWNAGGGWPSSSRACIRPRKCRRAARAELCTSRAFFLP
jgi:hypothetical protein